MGLNIKLFTHTDLDGIGCAIIADHAEFGDVSIEFCDYDDIDKRILLGIAELTKYDKIFITDISVKPDTAEILNRNFADKLQLLDHHETVDWLGQYDWAFIKGYQDDERKHKVCGTGMLADYLIEKDLLKPTDNLLEFVEKVRRYDTWEWSTFYSDLHAKALNDLFGILGRNEFFSRFVEDISPELTEAEQYLLDVEEAKIKRYIEEKAKTISEREISGRKVGVVFAEQYHSQLGNELAKANPHLDLIALINPSKSLSFRTVKDDVHVGEFAKNFGGGGHQKAAGAPIPEWVKRTAIDEFLIK